MNLSIKKLLALIQLVLICGAIFSIEQSIAQSTSVYSQRKIKTVLFDLRFIMNNETFALQRVYFDGLENSVRNCVFESPSALWVIRYCHLGEIEAEDPWYLFLVGSFSIKDADIQLEYYLERESNIYRNIEYGSLVFTRNLSLMKMDLIDGGLTVNMGWSKDRLSFLQNLARTQEQYIEQSLEVEPVEED